MAQYITVHELPALQDLYSQPRPVLSNTVWQQVPEHLVSDQQVLRQLLSPNYKTFERIPPAA